MALRHVDNSIGERPHRVVLENPGDPVPDPDGGYTESWNVLASLWGRVSPASEADLRNVVAGTVTALLPYLVVVPFVPGVNTETRVGYHGRHFAVQAVRNVDERDITLEIICEERIDGGGAGSSRASTDVQPPTPPAVDVPATPETPATPDGPAAPETPGAIVPDGDGGYTTEGAAS